MRKGRAAAVDRRIAGFVLRRALLGVLVLFLVSVVVFAATQALPGDPARAILGRSATPQALAALRAKLHLGKPVLDQYWTWLVGLLHGNLGTSLAAQEPVTTLLKDRLANTAVLVLLSGIISIPLSIALGSYSALHRDGLFDGIWSVVTLVLAAMPEFVVGVGLVILFATIVLHVLPAISQIPPGTAAWSNLTGLVLPTATLVIAVMPYVTRIMRASMIEVLESDYVEMARLKGMP